MHEFSVSENVFPCCFEDCTVWKMHADTVELIPLEQFVIESHESPSVHDVFLWRPEAVECAIADATDFATSPSHVEPYSPAFVDSDLLIGHFKASIKNSFLVPTNATRKEIKV